MPPTIVTPTVLTASPGQKRDICRLFYTSLTDPAMRKTHRLLGTTPQPTEAAIGMDFQLWFAGFVSLANVLEPEATWPGIEEMARYVTEHVDEALKAIAA